MDDDPTPAHGDEQRAGQEPLDPGRADDERSAEQPADGRQAPADAPARPRRRLLLVAVALLSVVALGFGLLAASLQGTVRAERAERAEVQRVAGAMAAALLTYDHEDLEAARERVLALATGKFRTEYRTAFEGLRTLLAEAKASSRGTVTDVFVRMDDDEPTAGAIVVVNTVAEGAAGRRATVASYIQLDLVKVDGRWRVDGVTNLNFGSSPVDLDPEPAPGSVTTTAP